jgi:surfeit locus 1 family protein
MSSLMSKNRSVVFFAPRPWAVPATALLLGGCVALGFWQIARAREKQALIDEYRRGGDTIVDATALEFESLARYQSVRLRGAFDPQRQILLDNMPSAEGRPGYRVLTPMRRAAPGPLVLVDRGWMPLGRSRDQLPDIGVSSVEREVAGRLGELPRPGWRLGAADAAGSTGWPRVMNFPGATELAAALGETVEGRIVLLHPDAPAGFEREWRPAMRMGPERHLGYAIQWFGLAIAAVIVFAATSLRRESPSGREP